MGVQTKKNHRKKRSRTQKQKRGGGYLWDSPKEKLIKKTKKELKELQAKQNKIQRQIQYYTGHLVRTNVNNPSKHDLKIEKDNLDIEIDEKTKLLEEYKKFPDTITQKQLDDLLLFTDIVNKEKNRSFNSIINSPTNTPTPTSNTTPILNEPEIVRLSQSDSSSGKTKSDDFIFHKALRKNNKSRRIQQSNDYDIIKNNKSIINQTLYNIKKKTQVPFYRPIDAFVAKKTNSTRMLFGLKHHVPYDVQVKQWNEYLEDAKKNPTKAAIENAIENAELVERVEKREAAAREVEAREAKKIKERKALAKAR